jgi:HK97 family phage major capsid protein
MGIFNSTVIEASSDLQVDEITNTTLDEIMFSFGGNEDVEDAAVLILNKRDLKAFAQLRSTTGEKIHTIVSNGNYGTIDGVPYVINSQCKAISNEATTAGEYCMAYGPLSNYELAVFSDIEVKKSTDYKFKEGMLAHRGVTFIGGNVAAHNGFLRVKKKATA